MAPALSVVRQKSWLSSSPKACVGFVNYYKTQFNEVCCFSFSLRKALCASQLVFSSGLHSTSAGLTQDTTMPAKHCPAAVMRPSELQTPVCSLASERGWNVTSCSPTEHPMIKGTVEFCIFYTIYSILSRLQSKTKTYQRLGLIFFTKVCANCWFQCDQHWQKAACSSVRV